MAVDVADDKEEFAFHLRLMQHHCWKIGCLVYTLLHSRKSSVPGNAPETQEEHGHAFVLYCIRFLLFYVYVFDGCISRGRTDNTT